MHSLITWSLLSAVAAAASPPPLQFTDIDGKLHQPWKTPKRRAVVVVFITTDCPIANYYQPSLARADKRFRKQKVEFFLCHSDPDCTLSEIRKHQEEFRIVSPIILDREQKLARRLNAKVTPEAFVLDEKGEVVYRGRIDDLYVDFGKRRREATRHDLEDALNALLAGKPIAHPKTKPVGCYIYFPKSAK